MILLIFCDAQTHGASPGWQKGRARSPSKLASPPDPPPPAPPPPPETPPVNALGSVWNGYIDGEQLAKIEMLAFRWMDLKEIAMQIGLPVDVVQFHPVYRLANIEAKRIG